MEAELVIFPDSRVSGKTEILCTLFTDRDVIVTKESFTIIAATPTNEVLLLLFNMKYTIKCIFIRKLTHVIPVFSFYPIISSLNNLFCVTNDL